MDWLMGAKKFFLQYINGCNYGIKTSEGDQETKSKWALRQGEIRTKIREAPHKPVTPVYQVHLMSHCCFLPRLFPQWDLRAYQQYHFSNSLYNYLMLAFLVFYCIPITYWCQAAEK